MPKVRRQNLLPALLDHLIDRIRSRNIAAEELGRFVDWLDSEPDVPARKWFKRLPGMTVCGEVDLVKTFLRPEQVPTGDEVR